MKLGGSFKVTKDDRPSVNMPRRSASFTLANPQLIIMQLGKPLVIVSQSYVLKLPKKLIKSLSNHTSVKC